MMAIHGLGLKDGLFCPRLQTTSVPHVTIVHAAIKPQVSRPPRSPVPPSTRLIAVQQLLRIEEEGAYSGLVNGSATASTSAPSSYQPVKVTGQGSDDNDDEEDAEVILQQKSVLLLNKSSKYVCIQYDFKEFFL